MAQDLVFGKYEIQHRLAIGGMGEVFYAVQKGVPGFERAVILKSLLPDLAAQEGFIDQFLDEARVAATLNHPNVVSIYEVGLWNDTYFIAMEYIRGRNLAQLVRRSKENESLVPPVVAAKIIRDAALGLHHAHTACDTNGQPVGIVHRDISPQNIMVRDDGVTKVVDFGIARGANRATRTATGTLKGKLAYMAPEQILGTDIGPPLDQFALGIVFWELLTGKRLFKADSDLAVAKRVLEEPIPLPSSLVPGVPAQLERVAMRMLERGIAQRFPSLDEAARTLTEAMTGLTPTGADPVTLFMRRLGTDDLVVKVKPGSQGNFVISLKRGAHGSGQEPAGLTPAVAVSVPPPAPEPPPRAAWKLPAAVGGAVVALGLVATLVLLRPAPTRLRRRRRRLRRPPSW